MHPKFSALFPSVLQGRPLALHEAAGLPELLPRHLPDLLALAGAASAPPPFACGIINAKSGLCREDCRFCAQSSRHAAGAPVHPLVPLDTLLAQAERFAAAGLRYMGIVTAGGASGARDFERICRAAEAIRARVDIGLCASLGLLSFEQARELRATGFASCHHNLETSRGFYPSVCTTHGHERRVRTVENAKAAGLRVCSGGIFGLGESMGQRLDLCAELQNLDVDSIPVNFLLPIPGTPLEKRPLLPAWEALAILAFMRLMHPGKDIICCAGRTRVLRRCEALLFAAGANGIMSGDFLTAKGSSLRRDAALLAALGVEGSLFPGRSRAGRKSRNSRL